ncbi:reverse transcriptase domain-containing protein, partial [Tanacetum coccineum]
YCLHQKKPKPDSDPLTGSSKDPSIPAAEGKVRGKVCVERRCCKEPIEATRIIRRANETLPDFKECCTQEMICILDVPMVMQISSFVNNSKCPELAKRFADRYGVTKGRAPIEEHGESFQRKSTPRLGYGNGNHRVDNFHNRRNDQYQPYVPPRSNNRRYDGRRQELYNVGLESLRKQPKEILATEPQLQLPPCPPTVGTPRKENLDRYCDYHGEKGHYINDCHMLKKQLEAALESGKLNHLIKDVRQRGNTRGRTAANNGGRVSDDLLIIEAEVEGYLVKRVFVDQGATIQVIFEHCFDNLPAFVRSRLTATQTELVGFSGEQLLPLGKIELKVAFGTEGISRRMMMKFTVMIAASPYNVILGRTEKKPAPEEERAPEQEQLQTKEEEVLRAYGVTEGKFIGYMVTSEGIWVNPKKTKEVSDMQSPKTLREMQSLSGKLAALNRFLSKSAERSLPFFETLKNITKENKDEYSWTEVAEKAFQELKKLIMELPTLTTLIKKEPLFIYLATSRDAVSGVLMAERTGRQAPIRYVSRTLHEAERNYALLEKLIMCLLHLS